MRATILIVEDEISIRRLARQILENRGYDVLEAGGGEEAIDVAASHEGAIDLVVSDVVMPRLSGPETAERLRALRPGLTVLFMSGYTETERSRFGEKVDPRAFLQKPFTPDTFLAKVREVLESRP